MAEKPVVTCPACEKKFKAKADVRGKKILCPFCDQSFVVPADDGAASTAIQDMGGPAGDPGDNECSMRLHALTRPTGERMLPPCVFGDPAMPRPA